MSLRIPDSLAFDIKEDIYLVPEEKSATFAEVIEHPMGLRMLAYVFSEVSTNKAISKIQRALPDFLDLTQEEFEDEVGSSDSFRFDEDEFKSYQQAFFKAIQKETLTTGMRELASLIQGLDSKDDEYNMTNVFDTNTQKIMDELDLQFSDLEKNSKLNKFITSSISFSEKDAKVETGLETTGNLMDAFDKSKPILYTDVVDYIKVDGDTITFDTTKYLKKLFSEEHKVDITQDSKYSGESGFGSKEEDVPLFKVLVEGMKRKEEGGYEASKVTVEGLAGKKTYDSFDGFFSIFSDLNMKELEKHLEKKLLSSSESPLTNVIYRFITPDNGKLDTGMLTLTIEKTEKDSDKLMQSFVRQLGGIAEGSEGKVGTIEVIIKTWFDVFDIIKEEYGENVLDERFTTGSEDMSSAVEDDSAREAREQQEEAESATDVEEVVEPESDKKGKEEYMKKLTGLSSNLSQIEDKYNIELDEKDIYQLWKDETSDLELQTWINSAMKAPSKNIFVHDAEYRTPGQEGFDINTAVEIEVDNKSLNDITETMFTAKVGFEPERYIDVKEFEIKNPTGKTLTGRDSSSIKGKKFANTDLGKKVLKLQMGYNRLKAMVE